MTTPKGGSTKYIEKILNRKKIKKRRNDIESRLHGEKIYIEKKYM